MQHKFFIYIYPENNGFVVSVRVYSLDGDLKSFTETDNKEIAVKDIKEALLLKKKLKIEYNKRLRARGMSTVQQQNQKALV